jgi:hypothetical protein
MEEPRPDRVSFDPRTAADQRRHLAALAKILESEKAAEDLKASILAAQLRNIQDATARQAERERITKAWKLWKAHNRK